MEIWDEHRWEEYFRDADRRNELFHRVWESYLRDHPPPDSDAPDHEQSAWEQDFHRHVAEKMGWSREEPDLADWSELPDGTEDEDDCAGESWKSGLARDFIENQEVQDLPLWQAADAFRSSVLAWARIVPEQYRTSAIVDLCTAAIQTVTRVDCAHRMGYEMEMLGGNIARSKRALEAANRALQALQHFRAEPFMLEADYQRLYEQGFEVRNALGLHVQQLREMFERGVD
jgi:hypothetical protein